LKRSTEQQKYTKHETLDICDVHVYDTSEFANSLVAELDFGTCGDYDEDWPLYPVVTRASLLGTATAIGNFAGKGNRNTFYNDNRSKRRHLGAFTLGVVSDRYGRKSVIMASTFLAFVSLLVAYFCSNYW
jgi:MFS family permease